MSEPKTSNEELQKVTVAKRQLKAVQGGYMVTGFEKETGLEVRLSKVYAHSTSAFAALGRLTQKEQENA